MASRQTDAGEVGEEADSGIEPHTVGVEAYPRVPCGAGIDEKNDAERK